MTSKNRAWLPRTVAVFPIVLAAITGMAKATYFTNRLASSFDEVLFLTLIRNDLSMIGLVTFMSFATAVFHNRALSLFCKVFAATASIWYLLDSITAFAVNFRAPLSDILRFMLEWNSSTELLKVGFATIIPIIIISRQKGLKPKVGYGVWGVVLSFALMFLPTLDTSLPIHDYATPIFLDRENRNLIAMPAQPFSEAELAELGAFDSRFGPEILPKDHPHIFLVIIESMSSVDSQRTSGLFNRLPQFDTIASEGIQFRNFFGNSFFTEGGLISLLSGTPPIRFPGASFTIFRSYQGLDTPVKIYKKNGYYTGFISSATLAFQNKQKYLDSLGFDKVEGLNEAPEFAQSTRNNFGFAATNDHVLYEAALTRIDQELPKGSPIFYVIETTSSHSPYQNIFGGDASDDEVWRYVDLELQSFYQELLKRKLLENGLLIITGDHHKMLPPTETERARYGASAASRIPLTVVGKNIPKGKIDDRIFQQSDLLRQLFKVSQESAVLSPFIVSVRPYIKPFFGENWAKIMIYMSGDDKLGVELQTRGKKIEWTKKPPPFKLDVESRLSQLSARLQVENSKKN